AYPKLAGLRLRIESDPAVRYALAVEDGEQPAGSGACLGHVPLTEVIDRFAAAAKS
ncbi:glutathione S-transferase family protein, partial [Mesorhizobium sp. M7A.F.Ca.CA.004.05.1.1]